MLGKNNHADDGKFNINVEKVCSIMPPHVKLLDMTVKSVDEMITILTRLNNFYNAMFRFKEYFLGNHQWAISWLTNKKTDFTYYYADNYSYLSIWLGKPPIKPPAIVPPHKRAKILHRYDDI